MNRDDRPIKSKGFYDLNFIDWNNELETIISSGFDFYSLDLTQKSPIPGMSTEKFFELYNAENLEDIEDLGEGVLTRDQIISLIETMRMGKSNKQCSICVSDFKKGELIKKLPCKHIFHQDCIIPWLKKKTSCPNCKMDLREYYQAKQDL